MKRKDLLKLIKEKANVSSMKDTETILKSFVAVIKESLDKGETVTLPDLGTFSVVVSKAHQGRNPKTGESMSIPAKKRIHFKPLKSTVQVVE